MLTGFGSVNVSAATNLVNPKLNEWENVVSSDFNPPSTGEFKMVCQTINSTSSNVIYHLMPSLLGYTGTEGDAPYYLGIAFDTVKLVTGNSYTFSMHVLSPQEIRDYTTIDWSDEIFLTRLQEGFTIGFGVKSSDGTVQMVSEFITFTQDNYLTLSGSDYVHSFTCPDYSGGNPCIYILGSGVWSSSHLFLDSSMMLVDNSEDDEEGFFSRLFEWFEKKFNAIGDSFSNLGNKLSTGFSNLGDRIKTFFSDLGTSISNGLNSVKEGIQNKLDQVKTTLVELGESLINGIKGLFVPDEDYILEWKDNLDKLLQDHLGMIYTSANLVTDLVQKIFDIVFNAPESYGLTVPEVSFEILNGTQINLIPETEISFDFMENKTFKFIYGLYTVGLYIAFGVLEVKYGIRVYKKVMAN